MVRYINDHEARFGVESICNVLPIDPSTYYEHKAREADPSRLPARARRDEWPMVEIQRVWQENFGVYGPRKARKKTIPDAEADRPADLAQRAFTAARPMAKYRQGKAYTAQINEAQVRKAFERVDTPDVEALVQVGTALVCAGFVDALEARHGKPVVAVNSATYWLALREHGIVDGLDGHGTLFSEH